MKSIEEEAKELLATFTDLIFESGCSVSKPMIKSVCIKHCDLVIEKLGMVLEITIDEPLIENRINYYTLLKEAAGKI